MKCNSSNDPEHECIQCDRDEPTSDQRDRVRTRNRVRLAGLAISLCAASLLAWPQISTSFRALMRHHYSLVGAVP